MAIVKAVNSRASIGHAINYITKREKTDDKLISGIGCSPRTAIDEMKATKEIWGKTDGRQYAHFVHSFHPDDREKMTLEQFHALSVKLCEGRFDGFEIVIATHKDSEHVHSHIVVNSVSYEDGHKHHWKKQDLEHMKRDSNEISRENGLTVPVKGNGVSVYKQSKYKSLEKAVDDSVGYKSYVLDCFNAVNTAKKRAASREEFICLMKEQGYDTNWADNRKHITFTDKDGNKVRNSNIEKTFSVPMGKEDLLNEFERHNESGRAADTAGNARGQLQAARVRIDNTGAVTGDINAAIAKSRAAVKADDSARAYRITHAKSRQSERDRASEHGTAPKSRGSKGYER